MNKLEKIFIDSGTVWEDDAKECANITEEIACNFLNWVGEDDHRFEKWATNRIKPFDLFQEFLKTL